jgi:hypothetical protein
MVTDPVCGMRLSNPVRNALAVAINVTACCAILYWSGASITSAIGTCVLTTAGSVILFGGMGFFRGKQELSSDAWLWWLTGTILVSLGLLWFLYSIAPH